LNANRANSASIHAVVPVKALRKSKIRLSSILSPKERAALTIAMLADVLSALKRSRMIDSITVVSPDRNVLRFGQQLGVDSLREKPARGLNSAITQVIRKRKWENAIVLIVHADLPLLTPGEVNAFLRGARGCSVTIGPSKDRTGTNAMVLNPAQVIKPAFGRGSYKRHISLFHRKRLQFSVQLTKGFGFDVDDPQGLLELMDHKRHTRTAHFLREMDEHDLRKLLRIQNRTKLRIPPKPQQKPKREKLRRF
jgi:2-phospho-L-lactate guanylyltransferase